MPDLLKVECPHCLGSLKLKDRSADGKKVRCPKCQEVFKVQLPAEDELDELDELQDDFGGEEEYQDEEPAPKSKGAAKKSSKKKQKSSGAKIPWAIIGIGAAVLLLLGGAGFVVSRFSLSEGSNKLDLTYLLPDANMIAHVKVQELLTSPLLAGVLSQPAAKQMLAAPADKNGFGFNEMVSITIGSKIDTPSSRMLEIMAPMGAMRRPSPTPANTHSVTVVRTSVPIPVDKMTANKPDITAQTHNGKTYHKRNGALSTGFAGDAADSFYFPEPNILVLAMEADLKLVIDQGSKQARRREFDIINPNSTLLMAGFKDPASVSSAAPQPPTTTPPAAGMELAGKNLELAANKAVQSGFAGIKFSDRIDFEVISICADNARAGEMKTALEGLFAELKILYDKNKAYAALVDLNDVIPLADKSLASVKVEQSGSQVVLTATIPSDIKAVAESVSKKLAGMAGGSPGIPPPGVSANFGPPGTSGGLPPGFDASQIPPGALPAGAIPPGALPAEKAAPPSP